MAKYKIMLELETKSCISCPLSNIYGKCKLQELLYLKSQKEYLENCPLELIESEVD